MYFTLSSTDKNTASQLGSPMLCEPGSAEYNSQFSDNPNPAILIKMCCDLLFVGFSWILKVLFNCFLEKFRDILRNTLLISLEINDFTYSFYITVYKCRLVFIKMTNLNKSKLTLISFTTTREQKIFQLKLKLLAWFTHFSKYNSQLNKIGIIIKDRLTRQLKILIIN